MELTKEQQQIVNKYGINQEFSQELLNDPEFRERWTAYLLSIQYNTVVQMIPTQVLLKETERIFKGVI